MKFQNTIFKTTNFIDLPNLNPKKKCNTLVYFNVPVDKKMSFVFCDVLITIMIVITLL